MKSMEAYFNKLRMMINSIFARGTITLVNDETNMQTVQAKFLADEDFDKMERFQDYGFTSKPKVGSEALAIFFGGKRSNGAILKVDDRRYRIKGLQDGEVAIYTDEGDKIVFKRGNKIEVTTNEFIVNAETKISLTAPNVEIIASTMVSIDSPITVASGQVHAAQGVFAAGYNPYTPGQPNLVKGNLSVVAEGSSPGDISTPGEVSDASGSMSLIRSKHNSHKHNETNGAGGTSTPTVPM